MNNDARRYFLNAHDPQGVREDIKNKIKACKQLGFKELAESLTKMLEVMEHLIEELYREDD